MSCIGQERRFAQAHALLAPVAPALAEEVGAVTMSPAWATMLVRADRPAVRWDGAFLPNDAVLFWVCRDASKRMRSEQETWMLHASHAWSATHLEEDRNQISLAMTASFERLVGAVTPVHRVAHRWRYALAEVVRPEVSLYDPLLRLGAAGDWCGGPRIEGALLSGLALAGQVLTHTHVQSAQRLG